MTCLGEVQLTRLSLLTLSSEVGASRRKVDETTLQHKKAQHAHAEVQCQDSRTHIPQVHVN